MYAWLVKKVGEAWALLIAIAVVIAVLVGGYEAVKNYFQGPLKSQLKVDQGLTNAMGQSGQHAVNTVGNRQEAELNGAATVEEAQHEIDNASDPGSVTDAGINGLHRVRGQTRSSGGRRQP
jgi:hypothetical protein